MTQQSTKTDGQMIQSTQRICSVDGCALVANRISSGMCEKHYMRRRRKGTTDKHVRSKAIKHSHGYVLICANDHPLMIGKPSGSRLYEHRVVFFDAHGGGDYSCHWCDAVIAFDNMHVDHLNAVKNDNRLENLVAACPACNMARGIDKMRATMRSKGIMITWDGKTQHVSQWAKQIGISSVSLKARIKNGWPLDKALTQPRGKCGPKAQHATG